VELRLDAMGNTVQMHLGPDKYADGELWLDYTSVAGVARWWPWTECVEAGSCSAGDADWRFTAVIDAANPVDQVAGLARGSASLEAVREDHVQVEAPTENAIVAAVLEIAVPGDDEAAVGRRGHR
jgi:hypothetical protein